MANTNRKLKILYLAPANHTGTLDQFVEEHRKRGHLADFVTLTSSIEGFDNGICFDIWPNARHKKVNLFRDLMVPNANMRGERKQLPGTPPFYKPSFMHSLVLQMQDAIFKKRIMSTIEEYGLLDYDIYHLEGGIDFFKDYRTISTLKNKGCKLIANYHGNDFRDRGVHPLLNKLVDANTTSEWDIYFRYPGCLYLHLPARLYNGPSVNQATTRVVVAHMVRNETLFHYKGTADIIRSAEEATKGRNAEFRFIHSLSHGEAMEKMKDINILVDQIGGMAGWGYGMTAVEALSRGIVVCVDIQKEIEGVLAGHPFVNVNRNNLTKALIGLIEDHSRRIEIAKHGREWVTKTHSIGGVVDRLYGIYREKLCIQI